MTWWGERAYERIMVLGMALGVPKAARPSAPSPYSKRRKAQFFSQSRSRHDGSPDALMAACKVTLEVSRACKGPSLNWRAWMRSTLRPSSMAVCSTV